MQLEEVKCEEDIQKYIDDIQNLTMKEVVIDLSTLLILKFRYEKIIYSLQPQTTKCSVAKIESK